MAGRLTASPAFTEAWGRLRPAQRDAVTVLVVALVDDPAPVVAVPVGGRKKSPIRVRIEELAKGRVGATATISINLARRPSLDRVIKLVGDGWATVKQSKGAYTVTKISDP